MKRSDLPFNVELLHLDAMRLSTTRPVTSLDFFETAGGDLHESGLFSIPIFGRIGDEVRDRRFSYIDLKTPVFHPVIFTTLCRLRQMYRGIMAGNIYAVWNPVKRDFELSNEVDGQTGFNFFVRHWQDIQFGKNASGVREARLALIHKYKDRAMTDKLLVMPAGLRDIEIDDQGRKKELDINNFYRRVISIARTLSDDESARESDSYNLPRWMLQSVFNDIYTHIEKMLTGKHGFLQKKWGSRRINNGTRNVITAMDTSAEVLGGRRAIRYNDTIVGLHQGTAALGAVTIHALRTSYLSNVFSVGNGQARLVDKRTLHSDIVSLEPDTHDRWNTIEGLEKVVGSYKEPSLRVRPIELDGHYLALIYIGPDNTFKVFYDIDELPKDRSRAHVHPINLTQLLYLSNYRNWNNYTAYLTRYPVTGPESCYPGTIRLKTTVVGEERMELDDQWQRMGEDSIAVEFPLQGSVAFMDSLAPHSSRLGGLDADFDGDTVSFNVNVTDEAIEEAQQFLKERRAYVDPRGGLLASANILTVALVLKNMSS